MKVILHHKVCALLWNIQFLRITKNRCVEYFTMISILAIEGWFSYFTNLSIRCVSIDSQSMKVMLYHEVCLSLWNIWFLRITKNRCVEYFTMINILPIEGLISYFANENIGYVSNDSWSMKVTLHQKVCLSLWNIWFLRVSKNRCVEYFAMISILPIKG